LFYNDHQFQYGVNASWSAGKHNVRFGAEFGRQGLQPL